MGSYGQAAQYYDLLYSELKDYGAEVSRPWQIHGTAGVPVRRVLDVGCGSGRHGDASDPVSRQIMADIQSTRDRSLPDGRLRIMIRGASHFLFGDEGGLLKSHIVLRALRMAGIAGMDGRRQLAVAAYCIHSFVDAHLKG